MIYDCSTTQNKPSKWNQGQKYISDIKQMIIESKYPDFLATKIWFKRMDKLSSGDLNLVNIIINHSNNSVLLLSHKPIENAVQYSLEDIKQFLRAVNQHTLPIINGNLSTFLDELINQKIIPRKERVTNYYGRIKIDEMGNPIEHKLETQKYIIKILEYLNNGSK
jgi:hypothetical protein